MRIIAGRYRRRKLLTNPGHTTRPIIDRAKVILFDRIRHLLPEARVADLFCGTGTLGLESLSRGAASAVFAERDHRAFELLRQNIAMLGAEQESLCWRVDLSRCSFVPKSQRQVTPYHVVFFDPPYATAKSIAHGDPWYRALQRLGRPAATEENALLVLRTPRHAEPQLPDVWQVSEVLEVASMRIVMARRSAAATDDQLADDDEVGEESDVADDDLPDSDGE